MSLNQVLRYVGFAVGSALTATVLAAATPSGAAPAGSGHTTSAGIGVAVCATTAVVAWLALGRRPSSRAPGDPVDAVARSGLPAR